jgi:hypothetical protein
MIGECDARRGGAREAPAHLSASGNAAAPAHPR